MLSRFSGGAAECAPAFFCSCYLPSRLYCRHRIFTGSASLAGGCLQRILIPDCGAWNHVSFTCLRERFAGCDRRFGISPTPEHDVDTDYATAHAGGLICFLWDNFHDKMTFYDCTLSAPSRPSQQALAVVTCGTVLEPNSSIFGNDLSRFHNGGERQTDQRVMRASRGLLRAY